MSKNRATILYFILPALVLVQFSVSAQMKNHLPYSIYGIGDIRPEGYARNYGMGRTGIALSSGQHLNNINPASYHEMDSISFFFDFGLSADITKYATTEKTQHGSDLNIRNIALGFRISSNWSASIGVSPYSTVAYQINSTKDVEGTLDHFNAQLNGSGGLTQFYWDNSYVLFKRLSLGVNATYLFGNITSEEDALYDRLTYDILSTKTSRLNKVYLDFGFQYFFPIKDKFRVTVGGIFGNNHKLNFKEEIVISKSTGVVFEDKITRDGTFDLPVHFGTGLAVVYDNRLTFSADYLYYNWSSVSSESTEYDYTSTNMFRFGLEYIPGRLNQLGYLGRISYRAGYYHDDSYLRLRKTSIGENGLSFGVGIPFLKNKTSVNLTYNLGIRGTTQNALIQENYHTILISLTLHDWWFIKPKYD